LLILAAIGVVAVGPFVGRQLYRRYADERLLRETIADLDDRDPHWRLEDLEANRAVVPDAENSANVIRAARAHITPFLPPSGAWVHLPELTNPVRVLTDQQRQSVIDLVESVEPAIPPTLRLEHFQRGRHPITYSADGINTSRAHLTDISEIYNRVLEPLVLMHVDAGDASAAVRDCVCLLNLARSIGDDPLVQTVRTRFDLFSVWAVQRLLGHMEIADADIRRLQTVLTEETAHDAWPAVLRGDRALWHRIMLAVQAGSLPGSFPRKLTANRDGIKRSSRIDQVVDWIDDQLPSSLAGAHARILLNRADLLAATENLSWHERAAPVEEASQADPTDAVARAEFRETLREFRTNHAMMRCMLVALAAERYRLRHGAWPAAATELVPEFLPELPLDPFGGRRMSLKRLPDGIVVNSIGPNGLDDAGLSVRLSDVARRRQPPPGVEKQP